MKTSNRVFAAVLAALMTSTLVACGETVQNSSENGTDAIPDTVTTTDPYGQLEERDLKNKDIHVLLRSEWEYEFMIDEETGDTVSDAIYRRNTAVEDKYNCNLDFISFAGNWSNHDAFANVISKSVLAGDGAYDMIAGYQACLIPNMVNGDLLNLFNVEHLTLNAPWWTQAGIENLSYNDCCYMAGGDVAVSLLEGIFCMFYNKKLATDYNLGDIYQIVNSGKWTHDKMLELSKNVYKDLNNDGAKDINDQYGMISQKSYIRTYVVAYDTPTISKEGQVVWNSERTVKVVEKLVDAFAGNDIFYTDDKASAEKIFSDGRAVFMNTTLGASARLRAMNDDFGIIPYTKWDESQENYMTTTSNEVSMMCIPVTAPDVEVSGLILEALCRESSDTVAKAFYDVALMGKYARDEESLNQIENIRASLTFDFGWVSSLATTVSGAQYETMVTSGDKGFASWYAGKKDSIAESVEKYLAVYKK